MIAFVNLLEPVCNDATRYFMDKVIDHLLVFKGDGDVEDFPGNYSSAKKLSWLNPWFTMV